MRRGFNDESRRERCLLGDIEQWQHGETKLKIRCIITHDIPDRAMLPT
jgi:hypothetical protein